MKPQIDWSGELQVINNKGGDDWDDFTLIAENEDHVYGHLADAPRSHAAVWEFRHWQFRNKPKDPGRVQCWVNVYDDGTGTVWTTKHWATVNRRPGCVACVHIDVPEGHGLER